MASDNQAATFFKLVNDRGSIFARLRGRWDETHASIVELYRHFLFGFFESDLVSTPGQMRVVAASALGMLASVSFVFTQAYYRKYRALNELLDGEPYRLAFLADVLFIITLAMVVMGLFTAIQWPSLFPGLRDYLALAALPVRVAEIFGAKLGALFTVAGGLALVVAFLPSGILPAVAAGQYADLGVFRITTYVIPDIVLPKQLVAILASASLGAMFVFFLLVALQGVLLNILPIRQFSRISLAMQGLLLSALLASLTLVFSIPSLYGSMNLRPAWGVWAPPLWFLGVDQWIAGSGDPYAVRLAWAGVFGTAGAACVSILTYAWNYRSHRNRVLESPTIESATSKSWFDAASARVIPTPLHLGVFTFIAKTLGRSRQHRLILTAFVAGSIAMIFEGFLTLAFTRGTRDWVIQPNGLRQAALAVPLALSLFVLGGLRYLFRLPVELRANWIFRIHEPGQSIELLKGTEVFLFYCGLVPVALLTLPLEFAVFGAAQGVVATMLCLAPALILSEALLFAFERIPFTSSYLPGRRPLIETVVLYTTFAVAYVWGLAAAIRYFLEGPASSVILFVLILVLWRWTRHVRHESHPLGRLEFEELPDAAVQTLDIDKD